MLKKIFNTITIAVLLMSSFAALGQTSVTGTQSTPSNSPFSVVEFKVVFSTDSLLKGKTNLFSILPYADFASISWKATGTTPNFRIDAYKTNYNSNDTSYWQLINQWDTTGNYTAKPVNDTLSNALITGTAGLPMRYVAFQVTGLTGNRENVEVLVRLALYRKP